MTLGFIMISVDYFSRRKVHILQPHYSFSKHPIQIYICNYIVLILVYSKRLCLLTGWGEFVEGLIIYYKLLLIKQIIEIICMELVNCVIRRCAFYLVNQYTRAFQSLIHYIFPVRKVRE